MSNFYKTLYTKHSRFYFSHPRAKKLLVFFNYFLTVLVIAAYAVLCALFAFGKIPRTGTDAVRVFIFPFACLAAVSLLRRCINRLRPYEKDGIVPVIDKNKCGHSFPSRHLASAFVIGTVVLFYSLPAGIPLLIAGALLGYVRFAAGIHYPSDLFFGALLGILFALPAFFL